ncbi:MAG: hypothetical protein EAX96_00335 [Candidatus Lokiarchaeota archaeon]|nr:hypothetical protein [Candidatus Lokiarchaeota archaeon]
MNSYLYQTQYKYACPECDKSETISKKPHSCIKCGIELCNNCFKKHHKVCIWCYEKISNEYLWKQKLSKYLMIIIPLLVFLIPAPIPIIILFFTSLTAGLIIITVLLLLSSFCFCLILRIFYTRKMINSIKVEKTFRF